ncbi:MAG: NAD(P)/FAD-dependent oxidoreductase [Pseudonocardiales bacterium]|nr:NAD(P)/FAD-dependent oxidoreductase [Pseudonocardiales bacterium]MBV9031597.1 NAD(P)/FAD-dependent oxidoreductase [Pseudonocardiales bacterium]
MGALSLDAVVVGGGHHGLVAATVLADAGWEVCLLEAADRVGGAVRSARLRPGYVTDLYSAFYPLTAASPVLRSLRLHDHGLRWSHAPAVLAHPPRPDADTAAVLHRDPRDTAAGLAGEHPSDGRAWLELVEQWRRVRDPVLRSIFTAFPPVRGPIGLLRTLGAAGALRLARFLALPARRMGHELFRGESGRLLLAGNALHSDIAIDAPGSGVYGWLLAMLAQDVGFPVPVGGAGELAAALARRAETAGAQLRTGQRVERIDVTGGRAVGVRTATGLAVRARRAVIADVSAPSLYLDLLPSHAVPTALREDLGRFQWDSPVVKVNWALRGPIPWRAPGVRGAGTVHVGCDERQMAHWSADIENATIPRTPFLLVGQMTTADASRSPAGTESAWAYTHLPRGVSDDASADLLAQRVEEVMEGYAPGFGTGVLQRTVQHPGELQRQDANLMHGAVGGGTAQLHQQLVFRPVPGLGRAETPVPGLYLGSAAAHPGGGVHGACGWLAARAALADHGALGGLRRGVTSAAMELLYREQPGRPS